MPFNQPNLDDLRKQGRDDVVAALPIHAALLPNSPVRVMSDNSTGMAFLVLLYLQQVAANLLPDQANLDWLTRWANIFLKEGPKAATFATGTINITGLQGVLVPAGSAYQASVSGGAATQFATTADVTIGAVATATPVRALTAGSGGNLDAGTFLGIIAGIQGVDAQATVVSMSGGIDAETVDELRVRVLDRIQKPPMGGDADDYVAWALEVPGVTRAWCSPNAMGPGTVNVRFMIDDLRATSDPTTNGFPLPDDVATVQAYIDTVRPVAMIDCYVVAPIPEPIDYTVAIFPDTTSLRAASEISVAAMLRSKAAPAFASGGVSQPAQTIYAAWVSDAILNTAGIDHLDLTMADHPMPNAGAMAVMGTATYG